MSSECEVYLNVDFFFFFSPFIGDAASRPSGSLVNLEVISFGKTISELLSAPLPCNDEIVGIPEAAAAAGARAQWHNSVGHNYYKL